jgi:uncharacterized protein
VSDAVTLVIQHQVRKDCLGAYEAWLRTIADAAQHFPGHLGVKVIRPQGASTSYVVVLRFASYELLRAWIDSDTRHRLIAMATPMLAKDEELTIETGLEYWFTPEGSPPRLARPYKQFLITLSAIYPLTLLVPWLLQPLQDRVPLLQLPLVHAFVSDAVIVFTMVYVVMPRYTRRVAGWLFR